MVFIKNVLKWLILLLIPILIAGCLQKQAHKESEPQYLKVSLLFSEGGRGDLSYNDQAFAGIEQAKAQWGSIIDVKYFDFYVDYDLMLRTQGQNKADMVIVVGGFAYVENVRRIAPEFPKTRFVIIDGYIPNLKESDNINCISFKANEGSFLVGATAALTSTSGKIGFIGGMKCAELEVFEAGYIAGAKYVKPGISISSDYIGDTVLAFKDFEKAEKLALSQYNKGTDIIFHAAGASGLGVFTAAEKQKKMVIGVDVDQALLLPVEQRPYVLTSMLKKIDTAVYNIITAALKNELKGGYNSYGLKENAVGYAVNQYNAEKIKGMQEVLETLRTKIVSGDISVPEKI